jgi:hypothetical protein
VLETPRLSAEIDIHALMFGHHDFVLRKIHVRGGRVLLREVAEPYKLHEYDKKVFSLLAAFYGRRKAGYYVGITSSSKPVFDLRDFTIEDLDLEIWSGLKSQKKYGFRALIHDVSATGFLYMDASDALVSVLLRVPPAAPARSTSRGSAAATVSGRATTASRSTGSRSTRSSRSRRRGRPARSPTRSPSIWPSTRPARPRPASRAR